MKTKRIRAAIALICTTVLLTTALSGCAKKVEQPISTTKAPTEAGGKHLSFSMSVINADIAGLTKDGKPDSNLLWLQKKFNFDLTYVPLTWDNYIDQTRLWLASGEAPDLMMLDIAPTRYPEYLNWAKQGLFKAYPEFDAKYPNLQKRFNALTGGQNFKVDGKVYAWPAYVDLVKYEYIQNIAITYRKDWAEKVGLAKANDEYTWEEWLNLVKTVLKENPAGNGAGKTIGMLGADWTFPKFFGPGNVSPSLLEYTKDSNGKWVWGPQLPESLQAVKLTKQMYDDGIIWKDQVMVKNDDVNNKFNAGLAFARVDGNITIDGINKQANELKKVNPKFDVEKGMGLAIVKGPDGKVLAREGNDQWSQEAMNSKISDEKAERWTQILDYLASDEGYYFRTLGIPGVDFAMEGDKAVDKWAKDANGVSQNPHSNIDGTWAWARAVGTTDGFGIINPANPQWSKDIIIRTMERYQKPDVTLKKMDQKLNYFNATNFSKTGNMERDIYQEIAKLMTYKSGDVDKAWDAWVKSQMSKVQPVLDELNAQLK